MAKLSSEQNIAGKLYAAAKIQSGLRKLSYKLRRKFALCGGINDTTELVGS